MTDEFPTAPCSQDLPIGVTPAGACCPHGSPHPQSTPDGLFMVVVETPADAAELSEGGGQ